MSRLTPEQKQAVIAAYRQHDVTSDNLDGTPELTGMCEALRPTFGDDLTELDVKKAVVRIRKDGELPRKAR